MTLDDQQFMAWIKQSYGEPVDELWVMNNAPELVAAYKAGRRPQPIDAPVSQQPYDRYAEL